MKIKGVLCGLVGVDKFFSDKFLNLIEKFQSDSTGCYGRDNLSERSELNSGPTFEELLDEIIESMEVQNQIQAPHVPRRHKRYDMKMRDGCSSHTSGLAISYFALYVDQGLQQLSDIKQLSDI